MMLALLLHETSDPHVHAGNSALSLAQVAVVAAVLLAGQSRPRDFQRRLTH